MDRLVELIGRPEGKTLEFKRDLSSPDGVLKTLVAFANTSGGTLVLGVDDARRHVRGIADPLAVEERLANLVSDRIVPTLVPEIEILPWRDTHVVVVEVYPSPTRPHHLRRLGPEQGVFVRVGSTNRRADASLIEELRRYARNETFDEQPMPDLGTEAIELEAVRQAFEGIRAVDRRDVETLRLALRYQGRVVPTVGGILLFGRDRLRHFPDAWVQAGRFLGGDRSTIVDTAEIRSPLPRAAEEGLAFVRRHVARETVITGARGAERWAFPLEAVREAIINAIVHADYAQRGAPIRLSIFEDRLEVENPGLLPFGLTVEEIRTGISKLRNRVIGRVFRELRLIEQWGSGIPRMTEACRAAGLPPPALEEIGTHFRVTLFSGSREAPVLDPLDARILELLRDSSGLTTAQVATAVGRSVRATRERLGALLQRGQVVVLGSGPNDPRRRYFAAAQEDLR